MAKKPSISIIGAGNVGSVLAPALKRAGYRIEEIAVRDNPASLRRGGQSCYRRASQLFCGCHLDLRDR